VTEVLSKFERFNRRFSGWFEWIGVAALLLMMSITCIDVVGIKAFRWALPGALDIVIYSQQAAIAFACGIALILGRHVRVEFFVARLPRRGQAVIDSIVLLLGLGLFILIIWRLCVLGYSFQTTGEYSATARIPYYPFAYGIALASIPVCLVFLREFLGSLARMVKR